VQEQPENGIVVGVVCDLDDPEKLGRVKVRYPHLDDERSGWARLVSQMAGPNRGAFFRPEPGDEVLVAFEHGDVTRPNILGSVWSKAHPLPAGFGTAPENNVRGFTSRSFHVLKFDDTNGAERIEIIDKDSARKVILDSANRKIRIQCVTGDIEVEAPSGKITLQAATIDVKATESLLLEATGGVTIKGATVRIN
jgi:uncharacterized protein involved in type VI secretion and phage assembly